MRLATSCVAGMALLLFTAAAYASSPSPKAATPTLHKEAALSVPNPVHIDQGGDTIGSAIPIAALPYSDSGTTAGYVDNYQPNCGYAAGAPDVVYSFSPGATVSVNISLCGSSYDTELYVFQDTVGNIIACNDDNCGLQSQLLNLSLAAGHVYYIIVDGYYNNSGAYQFSVQENVPCVVPCPPGSLLEGEPVCHDNYYDSYNGGCNSNPPVFTPLPCAQAPATSVTVCGTYGGFLYNGLSYRDTDWYVITVPAGGETVTWAARGETDTLIGIINGNAGCPASAFYAYTYGSGCTNLSVSGSLSAGTWWLWAGTLNFGSTAGPCGQHYTATLTGHLCPLIAVEPATWGQIKNMYK